MFTESKLKSAVELMETSSALIFTSDVYLQKWRAARE